jgi:hypothetical protein
VGDEAHIIARKETFTRGDYDSLTPEQRAHYSNLILLCKIHHKQIDDQPASYTVERLREIKAAHEAEEEAKRPEGEDEKQRDDIIYAGYVDEWSRLADLDHWRATSTWLSADTPTFPKQWYENQRKFLIWIISRIWPHRYPALEKALLNYKAVLQDLSNIFDRHVDRKYKDEHFIHTERFYKIPEWDEDRYNPLLDEYNAHVGLVNDLFFELTRAANYVCDRVRETIFREYRIKEGALLIERHSVGFDMKTVRVRLDYRDAERVELPYPGLEEFKKVRYTTRDYALDPNEPELPDSTDRDV